MQLWPHILTLQKPSKGTEPGRIAFCSEDTSMDRWSDSPLIKWLNINAYIMEKKKKSLTREVLMSLKAYMILGALFLKQNTK